MKISRLLFVPLLALATLMNAQVLTGIDVLEEEDFAPLEGKKLGLLTNATGVDRHMVSTIDILFQSQRVQLVRLFAPEHGVRGDEYAGAIVKDGTDQATGLPVLSVHEAMTRKPTKQMLEGLDAIVYDVQDVGSRSYTFISSLGLLMEAAAEYDKEVVVLDRPNPLGGNRVEGHGVDNGYFSFVSQFNIPYVYGLTVGELALYLNGTRPSHKQCRLRVVGMKGWKRSMTYRQTGLPWVLTSPQIPADDSPFYYPMTGIIGELNALQIGVGYTLPFRCIAAPWINSHAFASAMNALQLPGLAFRPITYKPYFGIYAGEAVGGVEIYITDEEKANLTEVQWYALAVMYSLYPDKDVFSIGKLKGFGLFDKVCGSDKVRSAFQKSHSAEEMVRAWRAGSEDFREKCKPYLLYD